MHGDPPPTAVVRRITDATPPTAGAVVMGTAIVSIGLSLDHRETLSRILLIIDATSWLALGLVLAGRIANHRKRAYREARSPAALTGVAGTAVLGIRLVLLGWSRAGVAMLAIATLLWLILLAPVLHNWVTPTVGVALVLAVSTQSLAVLSAVLAASEHAPGLLYAALALFLLGLGFYAFVLARFDLRQLLVGHGDHWVTGGALAISTLAVARIALASRSLDMLTSLASALRTLSVVLWGLAIAWLPILVMSEALRPRPSYDVRRWSTVFPVGMYAVCSFLAGAAGHAPALAYFARVWVWIAVAVWLVVFVGMLRRGWQLALSPSAGPEGGQRSAVCAAPGRRARTVTTETGEAMSQATPAHGADGADRSAEGRVLLHVWMIEPHMADRHIQLLEKLFDGISDQPWFVSARILESPDRSSIAAIAEMQTVEDRQRLEQLPQVHEVLYQLRPGADLAVRLYDEVARFDARGYVAAAELD